MLYEQIVLNSPSFKNILVPMDGSEQSIRALDLALRLAKSQGARLTTLYVIHSSTVVYPSDQATTARILETKEHDYGRAVLEIAKKKADEIGIEIHTEMVRGYAVPHRIAEYAKDGGYDLIAMGTRGRSGIKRVLLGSVAFGVVSYSDCNVLVVR